MGRRRCLDVVRHSLHTLQTQALDLWKLIVLLITGDTSLGYIAKAFRGSHESNLSLAKQPFSREMRHTNNLLQASVVSRSPL